MLRNVVTKSSCFAACSSSTGSFAKLQSSLLVRSVTPAVMTTAVEHYGRLFSSLTSSRSSQKYSSSSLRSPSPPPLLLPLINNNKSNVRFYSSWGRSRPRSSSSSSSSSNYNYYKNTNNGVQRSSTPRPMVNGKPVAFHIKDLLGGTTATAAPITHDSATNHKKREYSSNLIVILDMDECLVHSQFLSPAAQQYAHQLLHQQRRNQNHHHQQQQERASSTATASVVASNNAIVDSFRFNLPDGDLVHVHKRPGLSEFLQRVTERFETHIFTAAMPIYANPVLDRLDPDGNMFAGRWFRDSCTYHDSSGAYIKNLHRLPFLCREENNNNSNNSSLNRVVLVDNNPLSFLANPSNGILVNSFYTDPTDKTLPAVWDLLEELDEHHDDVRPVLQERFALHKTLNKVRDATTTAATTTAATSQQEQYFDQATVAVV